MSDLKDALNRILNWFQENYPTAISSLVLGLNSLEVDAIFSTFPFQVPGEVKDLYKWSNGSDEQIFDQRYLLSLESAVREAKAWVEEPYEEIADMYKYAGRAIFPVCQIEGDFLAVVETDDEQETSPVVQLSHAGGVQIAIQYFNLTAMMLTIAESYETGGFFIDSNRRIERDEKKYAAAYRNHNSGIGELAIKRFLSKTPDNNWASVELLHSDLCLINGYDVEIPSSPLKTEAVCILLDLLKDEQYNSDFTVILALEELRAVDALVQALKHPNNWVRSRAAFTLGKIKAFEAVEFVSQLLEDPDLIVQEAVQEALEVLRGEK
jgi:hypothetical protein